MVRMLPERIVGMSVRLSVSSSAHDVVGAHDLVDLGDVRQAAERQRHAPGRTRTRHDEYIGLDHGLLPPVIRPRRRDALVSSRLAWAHARRARGGYDR